MTTIKIKGNNISDIFKLECVECIHKDGFGGIMVTCRTGIKPLYHRSYDVCFAYIGDEIIVDSEDSPVCKVIHKSKYD